MNMVSETLTLRNEISKVARHVAFADRLPALWGDWVVLFLEALESESFHLDTISHPEGFELALDTISKSIAERLNSGKW